MHREASMLPMKFAKYFLVDAVFDAGVSGR